MNRLTREEVLHVANLARIEVTEEEIDKYSVSLKKLIDDIDKIKEVECETNEILVTPTHHTITMRDENELRTVEFDSIKKNLPSSVGKFVEVPVVTNND